MADSHEKGAFQADIPADAVEEALRSVEHVAEVAQGAHVTEAAGAPDGVALEVEPAAERPADAGALAERVKSLEAQLELSQTKARETLGRLEEMHDRYLRSAADLENYRKRAAREKEEIQKFGAERLLKDLLPVVDGLDRALAAATSPDDPLRKGVELVRATFEQTLGRHGVKGFSALGQPFDPARHEALMQVPTADAAPGTVVLEHARGFTLNERLVRPAMVGVAVALPAAPAGGAAGETGEGGGAP
jgi:molecular chaperone GrpE